MTITQKINTSEFKRLEAEIEDIRVTSRSIHEVVKRLQDLWLSVGVKVTFTEYPNTFSDKVSNTHNAPQGYPQNWRQEADTPKGYPGWSGTWSGTVAVLEGSKVKKGIYFSDVVNDTWGKGHLPNIPWFNTGSGGGGENFQYSGMLFIHDFPKMNEEFEANGGHFQVMQREYCDTVDKYRREFKRHQDNAVEYSPENKTCTKMLKDLDDLMKNVRKMQKQAREHYASKFVQSYDVQLKQPTSIFIDDKLLEATNTLVSYNKTTPLPELESTVTYIEDLSTAIDDYKEEHPEVFI